MPKFKPVKYNAKELKLMADHTQKYEDAITAKLNGEKCESKGTCNFCKVGESVAVRLTGEGNMHENACFYCPLHDGHNTDGMCMISKNGYLTSWEFKSGSAETLQKALDAIIANCDFHGVTIGDA